MAYLRSSDDDAFVVAINAGPEAVELRLDLPGLDGRTLAGVRLPGEGGRSGASSSSTAAPTLALPLDGARPARRVRSMIAPRVALRPRDR